MDIYGEKLKEQGAREEREAIVNAYDIYRRANLPAEAFELAIKSRGHTEPVRIARFGGGHLVPWEKKMNEIIDAVNSLTEKQA